MTVHSPVAPLRRGASRGLRVGPGALVAAFLTVLMLVLLAWPQGAAVWTDGVFRDTDDAMRMQQVRDLLAGQSFFDLRQHRMGPGDGLLMHWTRVVDVPLAGLVLLASAVLPADQAERAARLALTALLHLGLILASLRLVRTLAGRGFEPAALAGVLLSALAVGQFMAGRPDHHAPQLVLLVLLVERVARALQPTGAHAAAWAGAIVAASLAISVEMIPLLLAASAVAPLRWVVLGPAGAPAMRNFALGFAPVLVVGALLFAPGGVVAADACDAISPAFVVAGLPGAAGLWLAAAAGPRLRTPAARAAALAAVGATVLAAVAATYPACLSHPYAAIDPLLRDLWLSRVTEATPLPRFLEQNPTLVYAILAPTALGAAGLALAAVRLRGPERLGWVLLCVLAAVAALVCLMEVRALSALTLLTSFGAAGVARVRLGRAPGDAAMTLVTQIGLAFVASPVLWAGVTVPAGDPAARSGAAACRDPSIYAGLARLPQGLVAAPIDMGPFLLAHTPHRALAGSYHRNNLGNRAAVDLLLAAPDAAEALARRAGVRYVVTCIGAPSVAPIEARAPAGLAAGLARGEAPGWLEAAPAAEAGPLRVWRVR